MRNWVIALLAGLLAAGSTAGAAARAASLAPTVRAGGAGYGRLGPPVHVDAGTLPVITGALAAPAAPRPARPAVGAPTAGSRVSSVAPRTSSASPPVEVLSSTPLLDRFASGNSYPPDTQIAVSQTAIVELVNSAMTVATRSGQVERTVPLAALLPPAAGQQASDPRVLFDATTGRWFASDFSLDYSTFDSTVFIAVSDSSDPEGGWNVWRVEASTNGTLLDQPKTAVTADKAVITYGEFVNCASGTGITCASIGARTVVLDKAAMLAGSTPAMASFGPDPTRDLLIPAVQLTSASDAIAVTNRVDPVTGSSVGILAVVTISGLPQSGNVSSSETDVPVTPTSVPPPADQPGSPASLDSGDDRIVSATVQGSDLWATADDGCTPSGASAAQPCARVLELTLGSGGPTLIRDTDVGSPGIDLLYPAVSLDAAGNALISMTESSPSTYPSAVATAFPLGQAQPDALVTFGGGARAYDNSACGESTTPFRWGDYSAAVRDPADPDDVWVAAELAAGPASACDWQTAAGLITVSPPPAPSSAPGSSPVQGYWLVARDGGIFPFGASGGHGSTGSLRLNRPIVGMAATPSGQGYWLVGSDGGVFPFGDATGHGSTGSIRLNQPIVGMARTLSGDGYWLVAADGGVFPFGDAQGHGSTGGIRLNRPIVGMATTSDGGGYWLVASDGGIFPFGDAEGHGSTGGSRLNQPIVAMAATADGGGYWLVASDGGVFPFGDAAGLGSTGGMHLNRPIVGMAATPDGLGYWLVASDGGIFPFGDAAGLGSLGSVALNQPIVGMAPV